jgi:hypothetical protein
MVLGFSTFGVLFLVLALRHLFPIWIEVFVVSQLARGDDANYGAIMERALKKKHTSSASEKPVEDADKNDGQAKKPNKAPEPTP